MSGDGNPSYQAREAALTVARAAGHVVLFGDEKTLQLDLDSQEATDFAIDQVRKFADSLNVIDLFRTTSKSGNAHLFVKLREPMARLDRIFYQAGLGSDRVREVLNYKWAKADRPGECFLIEVKGYQMERVYL